MSLNPPMCCASPLRSTDRQGHYTQWIEANIAFSDYLVAIPSRNPLDLATSIGFCDLDPCDGGWSQNPMQTVHVKWLFLKNSFDSRKEWILQTFVFATYIRGSLIQFLKWMSQVFTNVWQLFFSSLKLFWLEIGYSCQVTLLKNT